MKVLFLGAGFSARTIIDLMRAQDPHAKLTATSRSQRAQESDLQWIQFDGHHVSTALAEHVLEATHILHSIPPDGIDIANPSDAVFRLLAPTIEQSTALKWLGYLSSTGVYGDQQGRWTDENTPAAPNNPRRERRAKTDALWGDLSLRSKAPIVRFRLAGIYGPGRSVFDTIEKGRARCIDKPDKFFNRTHVADIAQVVLASMRIDDAENIIYNVADGAPSSQSAPVLFAHELLKKVPPPLVPFEDAEMSPMARSFYQGNIRIRAERALERLDLNWIYPSYREGLRAIHAHHVAPVLD